MGNVVSWDIIDALVKSEGRTFLKVRQDKRKKNLRDNSLGFFFYESLEFMRKIFEESI